MIDSSEVWVICPLVSFLFARLGGFVGVSPNLEGFVSEGNGLGVVVTNLLPLLRLSVNWLGNLLREWEEMSEVRTSELETGLSSSDDPVGGDTAVSSFREVRAFHALREVCGLDSETLGRFRERFQFPERVRVRLPSKEDRACHSFPGEVCFYESSFICGLRLPVHPFFMELLDRYGIAPGQLMPNSWRILVSCMGIWLAATDGGELRVDELTYLYRLKESKEFGHYELVPWEKRTRIVRNLPLSFRYWKSRFFFVSGDDFETPSEGVWGELPRLSRQWRTPNLVKRRPKLKSRYKERVEKAIEYARTIEDWDDLVDPRTLAFDCLGPEPSAFVLRNLRIEGKKKMTTKFNKGMYDKMRAKKDEPLSHLGKKVVRITGKGPPVTSAASVTHLASGTDTTRSASPAASIEEIPTPASKKQRTSDKGKEKVDSRSSSIWDDEKLAVDKAREVVTAEDLRVLSGSSAKDLVDCHLHKLVQVLGESIHLSSEYLAQEAKVESALS
ncbi:uncharacterized protein LOC142641480 isoform X2 [Castanea sativa]|uniref:uncharacterized protein LOC142641480 isoform X2 n=1 Tax=Castanea sativa TaxID=21020 RepID=UPI003F64EBE5